MQVKQDKIPQGWKEMTLGEVAEIFTGKKDVNQTVLNGEYIFFSCSPETFRSNDYICDDKAIIIVGNGSYTGTVRFYNGKFDLYQRTYACTLKNEATSNFDIKFLFYYVKKYFERKFMGGTRGSSIPYIVRGDIESFIIPHLPLLEQKAISAILSSFDDKIELLRQQNKTLEKIAQTIFKEWFVKFTVNGKKLRIDNSTGLPEGWRMGKLGEEFEIIMGQSPDGKSYNESGEGMIFFQGRAEFQDRYPTIRLYTTEPKRIAEKFDVLVSVRAPVGDINVAFGRCCIGRGLAAVRGKYKSYALYKIKSLKDEFNKFEAEGTVFGSIGKDAFANIEAIIPNNKTLKSFEAIAGEIDRKIYNNYCQIKTISRLRNTLLPKLMKGEIRVKF